MIKIRLDPTIFSPGKLFYGFDPSRAVLMVGTGKQEAPTGVITPPYGPEHQCYVNPNNILPVTATGIEINNLMLEYFHTNGDLQTAFGQEITDLLIKGMIIVEEDGTALTVAQVKAYVAP